jgi:hypothetical protein
MGKVVEEDPPSCSTLIVSVRASCEQSYRIYRSSATKELCFMRKHVTIDHVIIAHDAREKGKGLGEHTA